MGDGKHSPPPGMARLVGELRAASDPRKMDTRLTGRAADEIERLLGIIDDALGRNQVTHIHAALRQALPER